MEEMKPRDLEANKIFYMRFAPCTLRIKYWSSMSLGHALIIKGKVISSSEEFIIFNVYAPCDLEAKKELWERLSILALNNENLCLCMCGDFNSVRGVEERKGRRGVFRQGDADAFNSFIHISVRSPLPL